MPKIYEFIGYIFFFYSNEHLPIHCHVQKSGREAKAILEYINGHLFIRFLRVKGRPFLKSSELSIAEEFVRKYHLQIVQKWNSYFIFGRKPKFEKINKL